MYQRLHSSPSVLLHLECGCLSSIDFIFFALAAGPVFLDKAVSSFLHTVFINLIAAGEVLDICVAFISVVLFQLVYTCEKEVR